MTNEIELYCEFTHPDGEVKAIFDIRQPENGSREHPGFEGKAIFRAFSVNGDEVEIEISSNDIANLEEQAFIKWMEEARDL